MNRLLFCKSLCVLTMMLAGQPFSASCSALEVELLTTSEQTVRGTLASIDADTVTLSVDDESKSWPVDELQSLSPAEPDDGQPPRLRVQLRDGSRLAARNVATSEDGETLAIELKRQPAMNVPLEQVRSVRLRSPSPATDPTWLGLFDSEGRGDLIALRRDQDRIDSIRGLVLAMDKNAVTVELDGNQITAPIEKLEGVILGGKSADRRRTTIQVQDIYGSNWAVESASTGDGSSLKLTLSFGGEHTLPLDMLKQLRWSSGTTLLAASDAAERSYRSPLQPNDSDAIADLLDSWVGPRVDGSTDLLIPAGGVLEYRVLADMTRLVGGVRRQTGILRAGKAAARILLDGEEVWKQEVQGDQTLGFDLDVRQADRVRLEVDQLDDGHGGDLLRWLRPRFVK